YVGIFNIADSAHNISFDFASLGMKGKVAVRDLWKHAEIGVFKKQYTQNINAHSSVLLSVTVK
ncbi:MAG: carbohydrate-binding protein, partial [Bacteroidota bacterium]|nr:carbohydrate-binding protein [Bacteroidota bacterium]